MASVLRRSKDVQTEQQESTGLEARTALGIFRASGRDVITVLALVAFFGLSFYQGRQWQEQNERLGCLLRLNLFVQAQRAGAVDFSSVPADLWACMPGYFYEKRRAGGAVDWQDLAAWLEAKAHMPWSLNRAVNAKVNVP
jgi:hypothetical protein